MSLFRSALVVLLLVGGVSCSAGVEGAGRATSTTGPVAAVDGGDPVTEFCEAWGVAADLASLLQDDLVNHAGDGSVMAAVRHAEAVAAPGMEDEMALLVGAAEAAIAAGGFPDLRFGHEAQFASVRLDRWYAGNCPGPDGGLLVEGAWVPAVDENPVCVAVERYLSAVAFSDLGSETRDLPFVIEELAALVGLLPEDEAPLAELLPGVYLDGDVPASVLDGTFMAVECRFRVDG